MNCSTIVCCLYVQCPVMNVIKPFSHFIQCIVDGRGVVVPGYENGNFVGPTILANVTVSLTLKFKRD